MFTYIIENRLSIEGNETIRCLSKRSRSVKKDKRIEREQGDVNTTQNRKEYWKRNLKGVSKKLFEEDQKYFLHQSL